MEPMGRMQRDYYLVFRLTPEALAEEIEAAYQRLILEVPPIFRALAVISSSNSERLTPC
jgi:hypothetical protein